MTEESIPLALRGKATKAEFETKKGIAREIAICDEDGRAYLMDGETLGGKPIAMLSDVIKVPNEVVVWSGSPVSSGVNFVNFLTTHGAGMYRVTATRSTNNNSISTIPIVLMSTLNYQVGNYAPLFDISIRTYNGKMYAYANDNLTNIIKITKISGI